ncbi:MAG TPA: sulfate adenylyltransferase subunit CysN [Thermoanaerobaculia bacterium]|nr:sulfate adenylyltransferase subunit CysN [Thermoanaerobaculia bacterium]
MTVDVEPTISEFLSRYEQRELLRFLTCGSVDDGKSTVIGRLLHDSSAILDDQLAAVKKDSVRHGTTGEEIDFALLVDGLEAEREQGITIDVAYRYFSTPKRKFIIADTPGHEQYTRNMATGASNCHLAIILIDARKGVLPQTRRHSFITSLLGIKHLVVAVNKMDLVDYSSERFEEIRRDFSDFAARLQVTDIEFIPMSALRGENIVLPADQAMPWYQGRPLLDFLENVHIASDLNLIDFRFPVQHVLRPHLDYRGFAGTVASGVVRRGDAVAILPSGRQSRIREITTFEGEIDQAFAPMSVALTLEDDIDVSRGDMLVHVNNAPLTARDFEAMIVWMSEEGLVAGKEYLLKQTTVQTPAMITEVRYRMNINTMRREPAEGLGLNEIGRVRIDMPRPLSFDSYERNRSTGAFILIDRITNATLAAGMILDREAADSAAAELSPARTSIDPDERAARLKQQPLLIWIEGADTASSGALALGLERALFDAGWHVAVLSGEARQTRQIIDLALSLGTIAILPVRTAPSPFAHEQVVISISGSGTTLDDEPIREAGAASLLDALSSRGLPRRAGSGGVQ